MTFVHGGNILAAAQKLGIEPSELIDMSSNLTPLGVVPGLEGVYRKGFAEIGCLPDATSHSLRTAFCLKNECEVDEVIAGNGTTEFIYDLALKVESSRVVIVNPTYSDYKLGCEYGGVEWHSFLLKPPDFKLSLDGLNDELHGDELVFICNPNNPTGTMINVESLYEFIKQRADVQFVVDESYLPFTGIPSLINFPRLANLFILCSSSKIYGIPGLRLGFMVGSHAGLAPFLSTQKPWVVNRPAQLCGEYLLLHGDAYVQEVVAYINRIKPAFVRTLDAIPDVEVVTGVTNFILCRLLAAKKVSDLEAKLLCHKIMIRDCSSFDGLGDDYFRISLQGTEQNHTCLQALQQCLA